MRALSPMPFCSCDSRPAGPVVFIRSVQVHGPRGSCTAILRIIQTAPKSDKMPLSRHVLEGQCYGLTPFLLPTRFVGNRMALCHVACRWVPPRGSDTTVSHAHQTQAQSLVRVPDHCG